MKRPLRQVDIGSGLERAREHKRVAEAAEIGIEIHI